MNKIIQEICKKFINEITQFVSGEEIKTLSEMEEGFKGISDAFLREIMKAYLEGVDQEIYEDKVNRKKERLVVEKRNQERKIFTRFGELNYSRTYYKDKEMNAYIHPVDQVAGIEKYERVSMTVATDLVRYAADVSYGKSSQYVTNGEISRQTVKNKLRQISNLEKEQPKIKRQVKILHIVADEDHVPLQDSSNTEVPLITAYEGLKYINKNRYKCINAKHFSNYGKKTEDLWEEVNDWIYKTYDENVLEKIYIHGDGAKWIKTGLKYIHKSKYVLDDYHENQAILRATGAQPEYRDILKKVIKNGDNEVFKVITKELLKNAKSDKEKGRISQFRSYINNNWEGIEIKKKENCGGCCAEGQVSHVLSARLSSRPMGWSKEGLTVMSQLRAYVASGGQIQSKHLKSEEKIADYIEKAIKRTQKAFRGINPDTLGNIYSLKMGVKTPTYKALKGIQHGGYILNN